MTGIEEQHISDLKNIQSQVRYFYSQKKKVKIYHGSTNSTRALTFQRDKVVDISKLDRVITVDVNEKYVLVEPNVSMDTLVECTLQYGLVPPVVMEFPGITVGGGIQGGAGESSSFKYGLFHDCCLEYEIVLGNGEIVIASPEKNPDLFFGTACSYGSLGIITLVKLRLVPAKDFVHLTYHAVKSFDEMTRLIDKKTNEAINFVDGIMFSKNFGVVMSGSFSEKQNLPISTFRKATDEWFYLHANEISRCHEQYEEIIPIEDYLFRYDRGGFWMGQYGFSFLKIPFNKFTRFIFNLFCTARRLYRFLHAANLSQRYLVQDLILPKENIFKFLNFVDRELYIYPLWLCPLKPGKYDKLSPSCIETNLVINVGVYGEVNRDFQYFVKLNRNLEKTVSELSGRKVLYAHAYYNFDEFWKIYDREWYNSLRDRYSAGDTFPNIYEKTRVSERYESSILAGIWKVIISPFKLPIS